MNDLEICNRIAEIEGWKLPLKAYGSFGEVSWIIHKNPLTDDALCFGFIVKDKIEIEFDSDLNFVCAIDNVWVNNENLNRAICMVKIKTHEAKNG